MAIFVPELSDEEFVEQIERVTGYITDQKGVITETLRESPWGRRRLAYTVRFNSVDYRDGIYVVYHFDNVPSSVIEIERELKLDVRVMRYLLVHDDPLAGEKDTGQTVEGAEDAEDADATTPAATEAVATVAPAAEVASTEPAPASAETIDETTSPAEVALVEETPVETVSDVEAPAEVKAPAETAAEVEVPAEAERASIDAAPAVAEEEVEVPAPDAPATEEEIKED